MGTCVDPEENYLACDSNNPRNISVLSKLCVNGCNTYVHVNDSYIPKYDCFPMDLKHCPYRRALGMWAILIMFIGVIGNLLTLLAIPHAAKKKR